MTTKENNRMNVVGVDPGVTTGLVVCTYRKYPVGDYSFSLKALSSTEIPLTEDYHSFITKLIVTYRPQIMVIESVVQSGYLSREKVTQIRAHDRALVAGQLRGVEVKEVPPQAVKRIKEVPSVVHGDHARDAYRILMTYFAGL